MTHSELQRLFVALHVPSSLAMLTHISKRFPTNVRWMIPERLHITMQYIGEATKKQEELIVNSLAKVKAERFFLHIDSLELFYKFNQIILWAGVEKNHGICDLQAKIQICICENINIRIKDIVFTPHITLGVLNRTDETIALGIVDSCNNFNYDPIFIDSFFLFSSNFSDKMSAYYAVMKYII